jgi:hypothetical protein
MTAASGLALVHAALVLGSGCVARTYDTPYYYRQQPRRVAYAQPQPAASAAPGTYGGARYGQPAPQQYASNTYGGAGYGAPAQPQYASNAYGGARYGTPAQPQYAPAPAPQSSPQPVVYRGPPPPPTPGPHPLVTVTYGGPATATVGAQPQPPAAQPDAIWVPADSPEPVWLAYPLQPGQWYAVDAWGAFSMWPDRNDGVDPYYGYGAWYFGPQPQPWAQLLVDDRPMYEIGRANGHYVQYRQDHYYQTMIVGTGNRPKLQIASARSGAWHGNRGGLWVRIHPAQPRQ